ncbi:MAG: hypothetical protein ACLPT4_01350 [Verrucomicrobiia bacterium]
MIAPREILLKRHHSIEPKLDRMWRDTLHHELHEVTDATERVPPSGVVRILWRELVLPSRRIWAGLACAWVVIAVLNLASSEPAMEVASLTKPPSHEEMRALIEQRQMLAQLIGPISEPAYTQKRSSPGPHSERAARTAAA